MRAAAIVAVLAAAWLAAPAARAGVMTLLDAGRASGGGGGTGTDLLATTGQPIYSSGTTPILVQ
jgi:hypothetical protein